MYGSMFYGCGLQLTVASWILSRLCSPRLSSSTGAVVPLSSPRFTHYLTLAMFSADLRKMAHSVANQFMKPRRTIEHKRDACCRGSVTVVDFPTSIRSKCSDCVGQPVRTVASESSTETIHARLMYSYIQASPPHPPSRSKHFHFSPTPTSDFLRPLLLPNRTALEASPRRRRRRPQRPTPVVRLPCRRSRLRPPWLPTRRTPTTPEQRRRRSDCPAVLLPLRRQRLQPLPRHALPSKVGWCGRGVGWLLHSPVKLERRKPKRSDRGAHVWHVDSLPPMPVNEPSFFHVLCSGTSCSKFRAASNPTLTGRIARVFANGWIEGSWVDRSDAHPPERHLADRYERHVAEAGGLALYSSVVLRCFAGQRRDAKCLPLLLFLLPAWRHAICK